MGAKPRKEIEKFFDKDGIVVRRSVRSDVEYLKSRIRWSDQNEIWASDHMYPHEALKKGLEKSIFCCTITNGNPIAMFGIVPQTLLGHKASIWMLGTDGIEKIKIKFLRTNKKFIDMMLEYYPYLYNHVDERNTVSIEWLKFCGAKVKDPKPYGVERRPFRYFYFNRRRRK